MKRCVLILCAVGLVAAPVRAEKPRPEPVKVPFELLLTKHIAVKIKVNGKGPYRVIFDTGAPVTLLNLKVGKEAGLMDKSARSQQGFTPFGAMALSQIKTLEVGSLKAENVSAVVLNHPTVEAINQVLGPIEGIVGFPFFARYTMTLDYQAREMTFVPNGYDPPDAIQGLMGSMMALMQGNGKKPPAEILAPAGLWGLVVDKDCDDEDPGVVVRTVLPGSPAARAGLKANDRLLTLDDRWTDTLLDCYRAAAAVKPGTAAVVVVRRGRQELKLTVTPRAGL